MERTLAVIILWFLFGFCNFLTIMGILKTVDSLSTLKANLTDPNSVLQSWNVSQPNPCSWFHVTCNNDSSVTRVDLQNAGLSGQLVPELGQLTNLQYLELSNNNIPGNIPTELGQLKNLVSLDLYLNRLEGSIPDSLGNLQKLLFLFKNNSNLTFLLNPPQALGPAGNTSATTTRAIVSGVASGGALLFVGLIALVWWLRRKPRNHFLDKPAEEDFTINLAQLKRFSMHELHVATANFSNKNILGQGGFGKVYKGQLADGVLVAVKRLREDRSHGGELQFQTKVELISMVVHRDLLRLQGFCMTPTERLLVTFFGQMHDILVNYMTFLVF